MPKQIEQQGRNWYAIHTYSGYEDNVAYNLKQRVESMGMEHKIFEIVVPKEKKIKIKDGKRKIIDERIFPGYVLVDMIVTDDSWYIVRNTPNVTGFIGAGNTPTPVSLDEMSHLQKRIQVKEPKYNIDVIKGDAVKIIDGPFKDFDGKVAEIDEARGKIKVLVSMFNRETSVELDSLQIKKI